MASRHLSCFVKHATLLAVCWAASLAGGATIESIGPAPADFGTVNSISDDENVFFTNQGARTRYRWKSVGGGSLLPLPALVTQQLPVGSAGYQHLRWLYSAIAPDGGTLVSHFYSSLASPDPTYRYSSSGPPHFRWTESTGWAEVPFLVSGVSSTGRLIGSRVSFKTDRYVQSGVYADADLAVHDLPPVTRGNTFLPTLISTDGRIIVGQETNGQYYLKKVLYLVRWVDGQPTKIELPREKSSPTLYALSPDGATLGGQWLDAKPMRLREGRAPEVLATLAPRPGPGAGRFGKVYRVNNEGTVGAGYCADESSTALGLHGYSTIAIWNRAGAVRGLVDLLLEEGLDVRDTSVGSATLLKISPGNGPVTLVAADEDGCRKVVFADPNQPPPVPLAGGAMLDPDGTFIPTIRVAETFAETIKADPNPDGYLRMQRATSTFTLTASMKAIDLTTLGPATNISFRVGEWDYAGTLGDDPKYAAGKNSATLTFRTQVNGKAKTVGTVSFRWTDKKLTVTGRFADPAIKSIAYRPYARWEGPVQGWIPVQVALGDESGKRDAVWLKGKSTTAMRPVKSVGYIRVPAVSLAGSEKNPAAF